VAPANRRAQRTYRAIGPALHNPNPTISGMRATRAFVRARPATLAALLSLGASACAHLHPSPAPPAPSLAASRERTDWIALRLRDLRAAQRSGDAAADRAAREELERAGVDWRSFLAPVRGSTQGEWLGSKQSLYNHTLRQIAQKLNVVRDVRQILGLPDRANDLARDGSVLDSAFFTNRDLAGIRPEEVRAEAESQAPHGRITVVEAKREGTSEGFIGTDADGVRFIFVFDPPDFPEMSTAAEIIGSTIVRLAGYNVPFTRVVTLDDIALDSEAVAKKAVSPADLDRYRGRRAVATRMIEKGYHGSWTYSVFRDRREVRALKIFAAWLNNADQVDHNTLAELFDEESGLVRYYVIDFNGTLGASTARVKDPYDGYLNNKFDFDRGVSLPLRLMATPFGYRDPWDADQPIVSPAVGRFDANLQPRLWKPFYPNLAYEDMDDEDAAWAARIVGAFSDEMIDAIVALAGYSDARDAAFVAETLKRRRDIVVQTYPGPS
jgi:hypothetical protein